MHVKLLEEENVKIEVRVICLQGKVVEASFNSTVVNDANVKLQQRVRAVERVNALFTDRMNEACFDHNQKQQQQRVQPPNNEIAQLRRHNTFLAGQVRALQEHIQGQDPHPPFMTLAQKQKPPTNLTRSQNRQLEIYRRAKRTKEA